MYLIYCLLLFIFIYFLPGLAFLPQLLCSARTAFAIPILSVLVVYCIASLGILTQIFNAFSVTASAFFLGLIALIRIKKTIQTKPFFWSKHEKTLYALHLILFIPYFVKMGTHTFDRGDELYSWNFWAIQHYFLLDIDFSHTGAPYPQLFPKLLAFCYHFLGSMDLQLPVKGLLVIFPMTMLIAISMATHKLKKIPIGIYCLLLFYVLAGADLTQFFNDGYADPIMTCALIISAVLFWQSQQVSSSKMLCGLSVLCAITCAHAKQAGLLWTLFSLPLLLIFRYQKTHDKKFLWLSALCFGGGLSWFLSEGFTFHHNTGVIWLSQGQRDLFAQLLYAADKYFVHQPLLFLLFLTAAYASYQEKILRQMMLFFVLPSLLLWFIFGAYQLRLGQHLIAFSFFIIVASHYRLPKIPALKKMKLLYLQGWRSHQSSFLMGGFALSMTIGIAYFVKALWLENGGLHLYAGGRQSLHRYFEDEANFVYKTIYSDPNALLWVPSRYLYGLFYHRTKLTMPDYAHYGMGTYSKAALVDELTHKSPDYVFTVSKNLVDGPASDVLAQVIQDCPLAFQRVTTPKNKFCFSTYKIKKEALRDDPCLIQLRIAFKG